MQPNNTTEHLDRIARALDTFYVLPSDALESLTAIRDHIAEMRDAVLWAYQLAGVARAGERAMDNLSAVADGKPLPHPWMAASSELIERIAEMERQSEAAEEIGQELLSYASEIGIYDGEDPDSALDCIRGEFAAYSKVMWAIAGILNSGSARPDDVEAAVRERVSTLTVERDRAVEALAQERAETLRVTKPFATGGVIKAIQREDYSIMRERIKDWHGPSDFREIAELHARLSAAAKEPQ